jgi:hypothetical protein
MWVGSTITITDGTGKDVVGTVTALGQSNPALSYYDTLTFSVTTGSLFTPDGTTQYSLPKLSYYSILPISWDTFIDSSLNNNPSGVDLTAPTTYSLSTNDLATGVTVGGRSTFDFTVVYTDDGEGVDPSTIGDGDLWVEGPNGYTYLAKRQ